MAWAVFSTRAAFDTWHAAKMLELGIPTPSRNQKSNLVDPDAQWTDAFVEPFIAVGTTRVLADVPVDHTAGLTVVNATVNPDGTLTVTVGGQSRTLTRVADENWRDTTSTRTIDGVTYTRTRTAAPSGPSPR
jgi:hypothetical protein